MLFNLFIPEIQKEKEMKKIGLKISLAAVLFLMLSNSAWATISGISSDSCGSGSATCPASYVSSLVAGKTMTVLIKGQYVDLATRVEISGSGVDPSISSRQGGSNSYVVVRFVVDDGAALGQRTVKLRYAVEVNGPDVFNVKIVRGGTVQRIEQRNAAGTLAAANSVPVNQRVRVVFTGNRIGNAKLRSAAYFRNPQTISCNETVCEFELEFTQTGTFKLELYDLSSAVSEANTLFYKFLYDGADSVTVTGTANSPAPTPFISPQLGAATSTSSAFVDVAPRANMLNIFRRTGNSITVNGQTFLQVEDKWCAGMQTPSAASIAQVITVPNIVWGVTNVGTGNIGFGFTVQLSSGGQNLQNENIAASSLSPGETRNFTFARPRSRVKVIKFAPPQPASCYINPNDPDYFEDPPFTVRVDAAGAVAESNETNNTRNF